MDRLFPNAHLVQERLVIYVPYSLRHELMTSGHGDLMVGHDGVKKCKERITECYFWPDMDNDLKKHMAECLKCQISKKPNTKNSGIATSTTMLDA